jgi:hypothetical protein
MTSSHIHVNSWQIVSNFFYMCKCTALVIKTMRKQHHGMKVLKRMPSDRLVRKFEVKSIINDTWHNSSIGRPRSVRTKETIDAIDRVTTETPQKSVSCIGSILNQSWAFYDSTLDLLMMQYSSNWFLWSFCNNC